MGTDHQWVAVEKVVREALADADVLSYPPRNEEEVGHLVETISQTTSSPPSSPNRGLGDST